MSRTCNPAIGGEQLPRPAEAESCFHRLGLTAKSSDVSSTTVTCGARWTATETAVPAVVDHSPEVCGTPTGRDGSVAGGHDARSLDHEDRGSPRRSGAVHDAPWDREALVRLERDGLVVFEVDYQLTLEDEKNSSWWSCLCQ